MPDSLVALRTALADAWLGDTHEARQVFGSGEAAKVFDKRLIDLLLGLGQGVVTDPSSISGEDIAGLLREISATSQAERIAFIQAVKSYMANTFVASPVSFGSYVTSAFKSLTNATQKTLSQQIIQNPIQLSKIGPATFALSGHIVFNHDPSDVIPGSPGLSRFYSSFTFPDDGIASDLYARSLGDDHHCSSGFSGFVGSASGSSIVIGRSWFTIFKQDDILYVNVNCNNLSVNPAYSPLVSGSNLVPMPITIPPVFSFSGVINTRNEVN